MEQVRRSFRTGLILLLPTVATAAVLVWIGGIIYRNAIRHLYIRILGFLAGEGGELAPWADRALAFFVVVALLTAIIIVASILLGAFASTVLGRRTVRGLEKRIAQVPIVRFVYPSAKQVMEFFANRGETAFGRPVMVTYPREGSYVLGFVMAKDVAAINAATGVCMVNVFVPYSPMPATGIVLVVPEEDVIAVDLSTEDALKMVMSGGVVTPSQAAEHDAEVQ